jgi:Mrp family chromosome partitioning ATPase/capsular polysaccharide biosynthesis protein
VEHERPATLRDYLNIVWRRKWIVLQAIVLVPLVAVIMSLRQPALYQASAGVLIDVQNLPANLEGIPDPSQSNAPRVLQTQAELARSPEVARRTIEALGLRGWAPSHLLGTSAVTVGENSDVLTFSANNADPEVAAELATEYARQFTLYRSELDTQELETARKAAEDEIKALKAAGETGSALYESLVESALRLKTLETLQTSRATLFRPATGAGQIQPKPERNVILGLGLGLFVGLGLAFLWEALDSRVRSAEQVSGRLHLPMLARLPRPPRRLRKDDQLVMFADPHGPHAEAFRILQANLELTIGQGAPEKHAPRIMVTSAVEREGKSTTVANLALAFSLAGRRVTLIDLDLRSAMLHRFFRVDRIPGLTDVALGNAAVTDTLVRVDTTQLPVVTRNGDHRLPAAGSLELLPSGTPLASAGELVARLPLESMLAELQGRSDLILIDGPPLLRTGDAMTVASAIDGVLVVARLNAVRSAMLDDLERILDMYPGAKLGLVVTGAEAETGYGYLTYGYTARKTVV